MRYKQHVKGNWKDLKPKLQHRYPVLTDGDFDYQVENIDQQLDHIAKKLELTRQQLIWELNKL